MNTNKNNILLAEFMQKGSQGFNIYEFEGCFYNLNELKFHCSWDWLIPVANKFTDDIVIFEIDVTYSLVVDYIKEYNKSK